MDMDPFVAASRGSAPVTPTTAAPTQPLNAGSSTENSPSGPKNGIRDKNSADVLAEELDSLELVGGGGKEEDKEGAEGEREEKEELRAEDWQLLDLCFGFPLFDTQLNQQVCC